jgi:diguanylate cyclase (GGDEF)-like protein
MDTQMSKYSSERLTKNFTIVADQSTGRNETEVGLEALQEENQALRAEVARLRQYRMLAYRDPLTGLRNRRYFDERLSEECDRALRSEGARLSLLVIDIDEFKLINDEKGHVAGDRVLQWVANFLNQNLRAHDICCRTGGDEFMAILANADRKDCEQIIQRIEKNLTRVTEDMPCEVNLSIGAATWPDDGSNPEGLVRAADKAMYKEKKSRPRSNPGLYPVSFAH